MLPPGLDYYRLMLGCVVFVQRSRSLSEPQNSNFFRDGFNAVKVQAPPKPFSTKLNRQAG